MADNRLKMSFFRTLITLSAAAAMVLACSKAYDGREMAFPSSNSGEYYSDGKKAAKEATVTVVIKDGKYYLWIDADTFALISNQDVCSGPGTRAVASYILLDTPDGQTPEVYVNWMEPIDTHPITAGEYKSGAAPTGDPLDIVDNWMTSCEGGYLTIRYTAWWGGKVRHDLSLVGGTSKDPYQLLLIHDAHNDPMEGISDALVAFDLSSLPDTEGKTVTLKVLYKSLEGTVKTVEFAYCTAR